MNARIIRIELRPRARTATALSGFLQTDEQSPKIIMRRKVGPVELDGAAQEPLSLSDPTLHGDESQICKHIRVSPATPRRV